MKASELRIGNYVRFKDKSEYPSTEKVLAINNTMWIDNSKQWWCETENLEGELLSNFEPIPLTEAWCDDDISPIYIESEYEQAWIRFMHGDDGRVYGILCDIDEQQIGKRNYYQHEIQNLYHALTGLELPIRKMPK